MNLKSLTFSVFFAITLTAMAIIFNSCEKETNNIKEQVKNDGSLTIKNGAIYFKNYNEYHKTIVDISKMTNQELINWESNLGFLSFRQEYSELEEWLDEANTESDFQSIVDENLDIVDVGMDYSINPIIKGKVYQTICNRQGFFYVDCDVHKITDKKAYITNINETDLLLSSNIEDSKKLKSWSYYYDNDLKNGYDYSQSESSTVTSGKRRVKVTARIHKHYVGYQHHRDYYNLSFVIKVEGEKKVWKWWKDYKTTYDIRNATCVVAHNYAKIVCPNGFCKNICEKQFVGVINPISFQSTYDQKYIEYWEYMGQTADWADGDPECYEPYYTAIHVEASSRGVGDKWAIID